MMPREHLIEEFLSHTHWKGAHREALNQDASFRRYWRLRTDTGTAMLMDAPPPEKPVSLFAEIARFLRSKKLYAPEIYALDVQHGLMLIEDFGNDTFTRILHDEPQQERALYELATDTLITLHSVDSYRELTLPDYDIETLLTEARLFIEWFYPAVTGTAATDAQARQFDAAWIESLGDLHPHSAVLVLRDYHVDNLMRLVNSSRRVHCGLLDFQDALMGSPAYDLISLLEDARRDISSELRAHCLQRYYSAMRTQQHIPSAQQLEPWLNMLAAQRHAKVLGIFVRLFKRDDKANYLVHLPRVLALYAAALEREPLLQPVSRWMTDHLPLHAINLDTIRTC